MLHCAWNFTFGIIAWIEQWNLCKTISGEILVSPKSFRAAKIDLPQRVNVIIEDHGLSHLYPHKVSIMTPGWYSQHKSYAENRLDPRIP